MEVATTSVNGDQDLFKGREHIEALSGIKVRYFSSRHLRRIYWSPPMNDFLRKEVGNFDVVHIHAVFLWPTWAAAYQSRNQKKRYVVSPRGMLEPELIRRKSGVKKNVSIRLFDNRALENASAVHFTSSREEAQFLKLNIRAKKRAVVPNGIELSDIPANLIDNREAAKADHVLYLGRLNWKKGLERLIEAMKYLENVDLVIAGEDEDRYRSTLLAVAKEHGVSRQVSYQKAVYGIPKWKLISSASVLVLPSVSENFGNVVLEAMAVGTPVVVSDGVGTSELVRSSGCGFVCSGNPPDIAEKVRSILCNPEAAFEMGKRGRSTVASAYTWDAIANRMEDLYESLLGE